MGEVSSGQQGDVAATAASLPITLLSPCEYHCMPVQALRSDTGLPLSKSSPSLTSPNPSWVNPSRTGGTSAGSAPHKAVQACTPVRNLPLSPVLCQDMSPPVTSFSQPFLAFHRNASAGPSLLTVHVYHRELYRLPGQSLSIRMSHNKKKEMSCCFPSLPQRRLCLKTKRLLRLVIRLISCPALPFLLG